MPERIIIEDGRFLQLIIEGYTSAYTIHAAMEKASKTNEKSRMISYKSVTERLLGLAKAGLIEETQIVGKPNIHARKDYKITAEGLMKLIPYLLAHAKYIPAKDFVPILIEYMDKFDFDKQAVGASLIQNYAFTTLTLNEYLKYIEIPEVVPLGVKNAMTEIVKRMEQTEKKHPKIKKVLIEDKMEVSDSVTSKAAHAMRVTTNKKHQ